MSLSTSEKLKVELRGHTAIVTIDNPGANTWDTESLPALKDLVAKLNENKEIYALVITGAGEKFFSAGADLKLFADGDPKTARAMAEYFGDAFETLADFRGVSIAAVNGFAMGGGLEVAMACDIRIAEEQAQVLMRAAFSTIVREAGDLSAAIFDRRGRMIAQAPSRFAPSRTQKCSISSCCSVNSTPDNNAQATAGPMTGATKRIARALNFSIAGRLNTRATKAVAGRRRAKPMITAMRTAAAWMPNSTLNASLCSQLHAVSTRSRHA